MALDVRGLAPLVQVYDMPTSVRFYGDLLGFQIMRTSPVLGGDGMCSRDRFHLPRPAFAGEFTCRTKPLARRTLRVRLCLPKIALALQSLAKKHVIMRYMPCLRKLHQ